MRKVVHFEIPADDVARAKKFYSIFDWNIEEWPMPDGSVYIGAYTVNVDEQTRMPVEAGAINGAIVDRSDYIPAPVIAINVPSIDDYMDRVVNAGGRQVREKTVIPGMGAYAYIADTEGNNVCLWEDAPREE